MPSIKQIYQLKITLNGIEPPIWRRIQIPSSATFWDLHSYIQDAFGWTNSHLHQFIYTDDSGAEPVTIGIPLEPEFEDEKPVLPDWELRLKNFIEGETGRIDYIYDLGDYWQHTIELEKVLEPVKGFKYPFCVDGARACPPEDCGGPHGYAGLLETLFDPSDPEHEDTVAWVDSIKGGTFHPEEFYPAQVKFKSPKKRLEQYFG